MKKPDKEPSHIALYRKYRPENFEQVIGQEHIVKSIEGAIKAGKASHAYLLCGPRGTGKTTIARIIASELGASVNDTYELDAASNRKIEDAREIREGLRTLPFDSKYKVYILDEVHMLTKEAWNALLKSIEEPPAHVVFILATTELEKVPETIVSRCQTFIFKKPTDATLARVIESVSKSEGYTLEAGCAELIALVAEGSFRDALSHLQKVLAYTSDKKIKLKDVETVIGAPDSTLVRGFISALAEGDLERGFASVRLASEQNIDIELYLRMVLATLRQALMLRYIPSAHKLVLEAVGGDEFKYLDAIVKAKPEHINSHTLSLLLDAYQSLRTAVIDTLPLELALVRILNEKN
jgi:DNA polymerase III subunit gamma/tau